MIMGRTGEGLPLEGVKNFNSPKNDAAHKEKGNDRQYRHPGLPGGEEKEAYSMGTPMISQDGGEISEKGKGGS